MKTNDLITVRIEGGPFAEDKDYAKQVRLASIMPALDGGQGIVLDFSNIRFSTQSFIHALIGEAMKKYGEVALERIEFRHCSPQVKNLIELVVDYSLVGFVKA